jgi:hypothetical protein
MKSSIIASISFFALSALSAPTRTLSPRQVSNMTVPRFSTTETVYPSLQARYSSKAPEKYGGNERTGHLLNTANEEVITSVYFQITQEQAKGTCKLVFRLSADDWISPQYPATTSAFDIYRLNGCLNDKYTYKNRVERGILAGVLTPKKGEIKKESSMAYWQGVDMSMDTHDPKMYAAPTFTCQPGEYSFEMVARPGVNVGWNTGKGSGLSIEICGKTVE